MIQKLAINVIQNLQMRNRNGPLSTRVVPHGIKAVHGSLQYPFSVKSISQKFHLTYGTSKVQYMRMTKFLDKLQL